jgi:hypothetical protein
VLIAACARDAPGPRGGSSRSQPIAAPVPVPGPVPEPVPVPALSLPPRGPTFRVAKQAGAVQIERAPLGMRLYVPVDSELSLDLVNGARVQLEAGSSGWLLDSEPATLVLSSGAVYVQLPPQGSVAGRPAVRVVTAGYALSIAVTAELWLSRPAASSGGASARPQYVAVLAGTADLEHLAADAEAPIASRQLIAGQAFSSSSPPVAIPASGPRTLDQARATSAKLPAGLQQAARNAAMDPERRLERALYAWSDAERVGRALLDAQRGAKSQRDSEAVQARQSDLVALAQRKLAIRQRVRLAYELACERALAGFGDASSDLAGFEARYAARVAPAMPSGT